MTPKITLVTITDPAILINYFLEVQQEASANVIKADILKWANSWQQNPDLWSNGEEVVTHLLFNIANKELDYENLVYCLNDLKALIYSIDDSFSSTFVPDMDIALWGNELITDVYERKGIALRTIKYLGIQPHRHFIGVSKSIEIKNHKQLDTDFNECLEYLRTIGFLFKNQVQALYKYLSTLPKWLKFLIGSRLDNSSKTDFINLFKYIEQEKLNEENRCDSMMSYLNVGKIDWTDPFEGASQNSASF